MNWKGWIVCLLLFIAPYILAMKIDPSQEYSIGTGIYDITGPIVDEEMMGYAVLGQISKGLHMRLRARTYIFVHKQSNTRLAYVNLDIHGCQNLRQQVLYNIQLYEPTLSPYYTYDNTIFACTHTHSGPAGYAWEILYSVSSMGFDRRHFNMLVDGIIQSMKRAHNNMSQSGRILVNQGYLFGANINRSPTSYLENPQEERDEHKDQGDTDKIMTVLRLEDGNSKELGAIVWFSVHPTSLSNQNHLISSDNKGYAEYLFEKQKNGKDWKWEQGGFLASFTQTNEGDSSANTKGAYCPDGTPCDSLHSTCGGKVGQCIGTGPGKNEWDSLRIIGEMQFNKAFELYNSASKIISGPIQFRNTFLNMQYLNVSKQYTGTGKDETTCRAALGYSFAAGTTDGNGWNFIQGTNGTGNPFWNFVRNFIAKPTPEQIACQAPKPILLDVGLTKPYEWVPPIVPIQMAVFGTSFIILANPGELTTMSGRRLKKTILNTFKTAGKADNDTVIVISGLTNAYCQYVATYEEYRAQRYEGASTLYGPHTLAAYIQEFDKLAMSIIKGTKVDPGTPPRNASSSQIDINPPVIYDSVPSGKHFGSIYSDVKPVYTLGELVAVEFWSADLKSNYLIEKTYFTVEMQQTDQSWKIVYTDSDFYTKLLWRRQNLVLGSSISRIEWQTFSDVDVAGIYRIRHFGYYKQFGTGQLKPFEGVSSSFQLHK